MANRQTGWKTAEDEIKSLFKVKFDYMLIDIIMYLAFAFCCTVITFRQVSSTQTLPYKGPALVLI